MSSRTWIASIVCTKWGDYWAMEQIFEGLTQKTNIENQTKTK